MRVTGHPSGRFVGYVHVQVASRVYVLPVEARSLKLKDGSSLEAGFVTEGPEGLGIVVDSDATGTEMSTWLAAGFFASSLSVPDTWVKSPYQVERPKWSTANITRVCRGSTV